ncbi:MAG: peptidylprolyl isomerase, partial [Alphaproteobacteria bacterium]|nr:peptidylprolyl isomerase [Alphaproteobacteria bacterium]
SAAAGGDVGWVYDGQLDPDLNGALASMHANEISKPVRAKGGWYLLGLQDRQEGIGTDVKAPEPVTPATPPGTLPLARLLLPMAPGTPKNIQDNIMHTATQIQNAVASCDALEKISQDKQLQGSVYMSPLKFAQLINPGATQGYVKLSDVSEDMQKALAGTKSGDVAVPFVSPAGVEVIARCDPRPPPPRTAFQLRKREDVESDIFQEQIAAMARRFMRDLRRDANIQQRNDNAVMDAALIQ